ncbi:MAG: GspE/PulE family protein, partial [Armatimonadota bacterium]
MATARKDLGEVLVARGIITPEQLAQAREVQRSAPGDIGRIIIDLGFAEEKPVTEARAETLGLQFVDLSTQRVDPSAVAAVPEQVARRHKVFPISKNGTKLIVAVVNPNDPVAIQDAIDRHYKSGGSAGSEVVPMGDTGAATAPGGGGGLAGLSADIRKDIASYGAREEIAEEDTESAVKGAEEAPIIRIAHTIIIQAIKDNASDIHVEPDRRGVRVRYRIDGVLHEVMPLPKYIDKPLVSRLKIMSSMDIAERRIPQDGRIPIRWDNKDYDLRVSCLPTIYGEKIVMRILDKSNVLIGLNKLGFSPE